MPLLPNDPYDDPGWRRYAQHCRDTLEPMVRDSAVAMSIYTGKIDPKMAIEMGYMLLLDKPIIAVITPGVKCPRKLAMVADEIVEGDIGDPDFQERMIAAMDRITSKLGVPRGKKAPRQQEGEDK